MGGGGWVVVVVNLRSLPSRASVGAIKRTLQFIKLNVKQRLTTGWTVRGSNPGGGKIFRIRSDPPWCPPSLLYDGYPVLFAGVKLPGRGVNHRPQLAPRSKKE